MPEHTAEDRLRKLVEAELKEDERRKKGKEAAQSESLNALVQKETAEDERRVARPAPSDEVRREKERQFRLRQPTAQPAATPAQQTIQPEPGFLNKFAKFLVGEGGIEIGKGLEKIGRRLVMPSVGLIREGRLTPTEQVFREMPARLQQPPSSLGGTIGRTATALLTGGASEKPFTEEELSNPLLQAVAAVPPGTPIAPLAGALLGPMVRGGLARAGAAVSPKIAPPARAGSRQALPAPAALSTRFPRRLPTERVVPPTTVEGRPTFAIPESTPQVTTREFKQPRIIRTLQERLLNREGGKRLNAAELQSVKGFLTKFGVSPFETSVGREPALGRFVLSPSSGEKVFILGAFDDQRGARFFVTFNPSAKTFALDAQVGAEVSTTLGRPGRATLEEVEAFQKQVEKLFGKELRGREKGIVPEPGELIETRAPSSIPETTRIQAQRGGAAEVERFVKPAIPPAQGQIQRGLVAAETGPSIQSQREEVLRLRERFRIQMALESNDEAQLALIAQHEVLEDAVSPIMARNHAIAKEERELIFSMVEETDPRKARELKGRLDGIQNERHRLRKETNFITGGSEEVPTPSAPVQRALPAPAQPATEAAAPISEQAARRRLATQAPVIAAPKAAPPALAAPASDIGPATARVMERISFKETKASITERFRGGLRGLVTKVFDDLYPIDRFVRAAQIGGRELTTAENPYIWARLLKGVGGKSNTFLEKGTFGKRFWRMEEGRAVPNFRDKGLYEILQPVREGSTFEAFSAYLVNRWSLERTAKGAATGIDNALARRSIVELQAAYPQFIQIAQQVYKYQDDLLQYGLESGLFSPQMVARLRQYKNYVPFHRVMDGMETRGFLGRKLASIASPIKRMKDSQRPIINPLESVVKNTHAIIDAADRNQVGVLMARLSEDIPELRSLFRAIPTPTTRVATATAKDLGISIEGLAGADADLLVDIFRPMAYAKNANEVTVLINGKKHFFEVDPDLYRGLLALDKQDLGMLGKFFGAPARWLRAGAVLAPDFMVKNPQRDQLTAFVYSRYGFLPGVDWIKGLGQMLGKTDDVTLWRMSGGEMANIVSVDRTMSGRTVEQIAKQHGFKGRITKNPIEILRIGSEYAENATRLGEFSRGIRTGDDPLMVAFRTREVSQDFSKMGTYARAINQLIPFFSANLGGWSRLATEFRTRPFQAATKAFLGITLPSLLLYSLNRDNEKYRELPQWQKDLFWIIPSLEIKGHLIRIPKPFMLGQIFGSIPERFFEFLDERDPELFKESIKNATEQGLPGFLPQALLPFIENITNHSFFLDRPIVPRDKEDAPRPFQYAGQTSEAAKALGKWTNQSPAQIDNVFRGYTGTLGRYLTDALDPILKGTGITPNIPDPSPELADLPILKSFLVRSPTGSSSKSVNQFYRKLQQFEGMEKVYKEHIALGDQKAAIRFRDKNPEAGLGYDFERGTNYSATARALRRVARQMADVRKKQREVYNSRTMTPQEKRKALDQMNVKMTTHAQIALANLKAILP